MKISSYNRNTHITKSKQSFNGHIIIKFSKSEKTNKMAGFLEQKLQPEFIKLIKEQIGEDLVNFNYKYRKKIIPHEIFVGVEDNDQLVIATGEDKLWDFSAKTKQKQKQVDNVLLSKVGQILHRLGIKDSFLLNQLFKFEQTRTGTILKENNKILLEINGFDSNELHEYIKDKDKDKYKFNLTTYLDMDDD